MNTPNTLRDEFSPSGPADSSKPFAFVANNVTRTFGHGTAAVTALQSVDVQVPEGSFVSLVGPSGCGKSTLLNLLAGLDRPSAGSVTFRGREQREPRAEIGMMFQSAVLLPWRTVRENIALPAEVRSLPRDAYDRRVEQLLHLTGLERFADAYPNQLSGGMAQRVALCRVLAPGPEALLMDEPFGALDEFTREALDLELLRIWQQTGTTVVFVTHNIEEAVFMSDQVVVLSPRPGRVAGTLTTGLDRSKGVEVMRDQAFVDAAFEVRALLGGQA